MVVIRCVYPLLMVGFLAVLVTGGLRTGREDLEEDLGVLVRQVVEQRMAQCYLVLLGDAAYGGAIFHILRSLDEAGLFPRVVVDADEMRNVVAMQDATNHTSTTGTLLEELRQRDVGLTCWALVVDAMRHHQQDLIFRFLEAIELYKWPETYVVLMGPKSRTNGVLSHHTLRNSARLLYLAYLDLSHDVESLRVDFSPGDSLPVTDSAVVTRAVRASADRNNHSGIAPHTQTVQQSNFNVVFSAVATRTRRPRLQQMSTEWRWVFLYTLCLYCKGGDPSLQLLDTWTYSAGLHNDVDLFPDQFQDFQGHKFRVVTMNWFPFIEFQRRAKDGGSLVTPLDSLDLRMLNAISSKLNFTYEMRVPWDNQWGTSTDSGNWTGIVGTLQHHKADFSMMLSWMDTRLPIVDYSGIYASEPLVMITSKPLPLSQAFALVRPFSVNLWLMTLVSTVFASIILWALQQVWSWVSHGYALSLDQAMMLTWGILLEDPPVRLPKNITAQVLLGWWWVYCMLLTITYRSSLIAHLTVPGKSVSLESLQELLEVNKQQRWTWGYEPTYGSGWEWLKTNESPTVKEIFNNIMVIDIQDQLEMVLAGHHAFITWKYYIRSIIAAQYTDSRGYTPIHTAREDFFKYGGYGWGYRKGAPFRRKIDKLKLHLKEGGCINFWLDELIEASGREARIRRSQRKKEEEEEEGGEGNEKNMQDGKSDEIGTQVVLGLGHLQGIFYLLFMGYALSLTAFCVELVAHALSTPTAKCHKHRPPI